MTKSQTARSVCWEGKKSYFMTLRSVEHKQNTWVWERKTKGQLIPTVDKLKYLGSNVKNIGGMWTEINHRRLN